MFKEKSENSNTQKSIIKKGVGGVLALSLATSMVSVLGVPQEVHALDFQRVAISESFIINDVPEKEELIAIDTNEISKKIIDNLTQYKFVNNQKLSYGSYRKTLEFKVSNNDEENIKLIQQIFKLLKYHGSNEFSINVYENPSVENGIKVIVGFSPDMTDKNSDGYADKLMLNSLTEEEVIALNNRYNTYLSNQGYNIGEYKDGQEYLDKLTFKMNYNNGRIQKEYDYIMNYLDEKIKEYGDSNTEFSLKVETVDVGQIRLFFYKVK